MLYFLNRWRASFIGTKFGDSGKKRNRKARAGKNSFPPTPFLFARPRRASGAIFFWGFIRPPAGLIFFFSFFLPFPFKIQHPDFLQKKFGFRPKGTAETIFIGVSGSNFFKSKAKNMATSCFLFKSKALKIKGNFGSNPTFIAKIF